MVEADQEHVLARRRSRLEVAVESVQREEREFRFAHVMSLLADQCTHPVKTIEVGGSPGTDGGLGSAEEGDAGPRA